MVVDCHSEETIAMAHYLIVANQTLGGQTLTEHLDELVKGEPATFRFVVPVTQTERLHQWDYPATDRATPDAAQLARVLAEARLEHELRRMQEAGARATGEVVDADPLERVRAVLGEEHFDGVVVATLPRHLSRWLVMDLPHRLTRATAVPVTHLEADAGPSL